MTRQRGRRADAWWMYLAWPVWALNRKSSR